MVLKSLFTPVDSGHKYPGILTIVSVVSIAGLLISFLFVPDSCTETGFFKHIPAADVSLNSSAGSLDETKQDEAVNRLDSPALLPRGQTFQDGLEGGISGGEMNIYNPDHINLGSSASSPYGVGPKTMFTNPALIVITE